MLSTSLQENDYNCSVVAKIERDYNAVRQQISEKSASLFVKSRFLIPEFFNFFDSLLSIIMLPSMDMFVGTELLPPSTELRLLKIDNFCNYFEPFTLYQTKTEK